VTPYVSWCQCRHVLL